MQPSTTRPPAAPGGHIYDVTRYGAVGDGRKLCTDALQTAIDACGTAGGGVVEVPPGTYLSGALFLRSNVHFHLSEGATLLASHRFEDFPAIDGRSEGIERKTYASLLNGLELENVTITGRGVLDGQGPPWWEAQKTTRDLRLARGLQREAENPSEAPLRWPRPRLVNLQRCQGVLLGGLILRDSPFWNVHLVYCQDVLVDGLTMAGLQTQSCDGVVIDSSKQVRVANCSIASGGESISIKSGYNQDGRRVGIPCEDVVIENCNLSFSVGAGIAVGSETSGGIKNLVVTNCTINGCRYGIHVRSPRGRGGVVERLRISNLLIDKLSESVVMISHFFDSVFMDSLFGEGPSPRGNPETDRTINPAPDVGTPTFRDFDISGLVIGSAPDVAVIEGLPERFVRGLRIHDVSARQCKGGISCTRAADVSISNVSFDRLTRPAVRARLVQGLEIHRLRCERADLKEPLVQLDGVDRAFVHDCDVPVEGERFVRSTGKHRGAIQLVNNNVHRG
jgi:polygalacturonase